VLTLGLGLTPEALLESDAAYLLQGVLPPSPTWALGAMARADLAVGDWLPLLVTYNLIFVLPPLALLATHVALGDRAGALLERLRTHLGGAAREGLLWLLGLVGFFLLADTLAHVGVID
jgi:hypothetical protein